LVSFHKEGRRQRAGGKSARAKGMRNDNRNFILEKKESIGPLQGSSEQ